LLKEFGYGLQEHNIVWVVVVLGLYRVPVANNNDSNTQMLSSID